MLEKPESWHVCQGELHTGRRTNQRERSVLWSSKLEELRHLSILTLDRATDLEFSLLSFSVLLRFNISSFFLCYSLLEW